MLAVLVYEMTKRDDYNDGCGSKRRSTFVREVKTLLSASNRSGYYADDTMIVQEVAASRKTQLSTT